MSGEQIEMFELDHKGLHGAVWWVGDYECRNYHGYFRSREGGRGNWCFQIPGFGYNDVTCTVYALDKKGEMVSEEVPIDDQDRITVLDKKYGRSFWNH